MPHTLISSGLSGLSPLGRTGPHEMGGRQSKPDEAPAPSSLQELGEVKENG